MITFFADWLLYSTHEIMGPQATYFLEIDKTTTKKHAINMLYNFVICVYLYWTNVPLRKIYCIILYLSISACVYPREKLSPATISTVIEMRYPFSDFPNALVASIKWSFKDSPEKIHIRKTPEIESATPW